MIDKDKQFVFEKEQEVKIKPFFWKKQGHHNLAFSDEMLSFQGMRATVKDICVYGKDEWYKLDGSRARLYIWDENWLEPVTEIQEVYTEELDLIFMGD